MADIAKIECLRKKLVEKYGLDSLKIFFEELINVTDMDDYQRILETLTTP